VSVRGGIVPVVVALLLAGCIDDVTPEERTARDEAMQELIAKRVEAEERLAAREREMGRRIATLEAEVADLRSRLGEAETAATEAGAEAERYKAGLGKAVTELNRVAEAPPQVRYISGAAAPRRSAARVSTISAPWVQISGDVVIVTGKLWNSGDTDAVGRFTIELLRDGQVVDSAEQRLDVPARTDYAYSQTFHTNIREGTYSARVRIDG